MEDTMRSAEAAETTDFDDLDAMFGEAGTEPEAAEKIVLTNNLEGFAHCFPDWDLHPPIRR